MHNCESAAHSRNRFDIDNRSLSRFCIKSNNIMKFLCQMLNCMIFKKLFITLWHWLLGKNHWNGRCGWLQITWIAHKLVKLIYLMVSTAFLKNFWQLTWFIFRLFSLWAKKEFLYLPVTATIGKEIEPAVSVSSSGLKF